jgi:hypothetical protein
LGYSSKSLWNRAHHCNDSAWCSLNYTTVDPKQLGDMMGDK